MTYTADELEDKKQELVEGIREYSKTQREQWRKIPMLALKADGRKGYNDRRSRAYRQGFWALDESVERGRYRAYIDLETGEIVSSGSKSGPAPETEIGSAIVDYVQENEPVDSVGTLKEDVAERTDWSEEDVRKKFMRMWHGDLSVSADWEVSTVKPEIIPASDEVVLKLANDVEALDASKIVEKLEEAASEPVSDYYDYDEQELESRQQRKAEMLGLSDRYSRG